MSENLRLLCIKRRHGSHTQKLSVQSILQTFSTAMHLHISLLMLIKNKKPNKRYLIGIAKPNIISSAFIQFHSQTHSITIYFLLSLGRSSKCIDNAKRLVLLSPENVIKITLFCFLFCVRLFAGGAFGLRSVISIKKFHYLEHIRSISITSFPKRLM